MILCSTCWSTLCRGVTSPVQQAGGWAWAASHKEEMGPKKKRQKEISVPRSFQTGWNTLGKHFIFIFPLHVTAFTKKAKSICNTFFFF